MKSYSKKYLSNKKTKTQKNYKYFNKYTQQQIIFTFLQMLNTVKLYHWKTHSYAQHKATDKLYGDLNDNIDKFVETMLGKQGNRLESKEIVKSNFYNFSNFQKFKNQIEEYKKFLIDMTKDANLNLTYNSDLLNIRDEILGNINQFEYLLTFD
jgi:DNA-binding ferritin-like protein